jgi:hypothetical protein
MVRPPGLPRPVREHRPHDVSVGDLGIPGPGAYESHDPRDRRLGYFPRAGRDPARLHPEDLRTPTFRKQCLDKPPPDAYTITHVPCSGLKVQVRFTRAQRFIAGQTDLNPGPGAYDMGASDPVDDSRKHGVSFTHERRIPRTSHQDLEQPGPGAYTPTLPPKRLRSATFSRASRIPPDPKPFALGANTADSPSFKSASRLSSASATRAKQPLGSAAPGVSFSKAARIPAVVSDKLTAPGVGRYSPAFGVVDKRPRSAVLYTGG